MLFSPEVDKYILCMEKNEQHKFKYLEQVARVVQLLSDTMLLLRRNVKITPHVHPRGKVSLGL